MAGKRWPRTKRRGQADQPSCSQDPVTASTDAGAAQPLRKFSLDTLPSGSHFLPDTPMSRVTSASSKEAPEFTWELIQPLIFGMIASFP